MSAVKKLNDKPGSVTREQVIKIHIAKNQLNLDEESYRDVLSGFGVITSKQLSEKHADQLLGVFRKIGWKPAAGNKKRFQIRLPGNRSEDYATQKQMNMLCALWVKYSNQKNEQNFVRFVSGIAKVDRPEWLLKKDVRKIRKAIESLKQGVSNET